ncbi:MAG: hypothetical protein ACLR3C_05630 [Eggerthella lenta]
MRGVGEARQCQVHRGGFLVEAFDPRTCARASVPGLHVVGEALDVDAPCGGYKLLGVGERHVGGRRRESLMEGARRA